jgi:bifunctional DNA-binding transcriptional regulator/antitoxin component of YhaV-PrlF toxin-antitoxin module
MTTKNVTITSKNQITIPAEIVRELQLDKHRSLTIRRHGDELILKAQPDLEDQLSVIWKQLPKFNGTKNDTELKATTTEAWKNKNL